MTRLLSHHQHSSPEEGGDGGGQGGDLWREGEVAVAQASAVVHAAPAPTESGHSHTAVALHSGLALQDYPCNQAQFSGHLI